MSYIEAAKFNTEAALKGSSLRAHVTEAQGSPHAPVDIEIKDGKKVIMEVQAKSMSNPKVATVKLSQPKYRGMGKLVPKGQENEVRRISEKGAERGNIYAEDYKDTARRVTGELKARAISSSGTTYQENMEAAQSPNWYAAKQELKYVAKEGGTAAGYAAASGFIVKGAISGMKNAMAVLKGEMTGKDAAIETMKDAASAGTRGGATGMGGTIIRHGATKIGIDALTKSNVATAVAAGTIEVGVTIFSYARGEITACQAMEMMGQTGASTMSSIYAGAVAGLVFGPVGAVVGSVAGYLLASHAYNSCLSILKQAQLAEEQSARIVALCDEACREMEAQRREFEIFIQKNLQSRQEKFMSCLAAIDLGLSSESPEVTTLALADFAALVGRELRYSTFGEFDSFMMTTDEPLII